MSVIACKNYKDKIVLGADSIVILDDSQEKQRYAKIVDLGNIAFASSGYAKDQSLMVLFCKNHLPKEASEDGFTEFLSEFIEWSTKRDISFSLRTDFIFIFNKKAFLVAADFYIREIMEEEYEAHGAGRNFAVSALYLGHTIVESISAACHHSPYCEKPINIIEVKK